MNFKEACLQEKPFKFDGYLYQVEEGMLMSYEYDLKTWCFAHYCIDWIMRSLTKKVEIQEILKDSK